jgi:hypothetical protein
MMWGKINVLINDVGKINVLINDVGEDKRVDK